jgi:DNA-binding NarL/FixJ family response regulator
MGKPGEGGRGIDIAARDREMVRLRNEGYSLEAIGILFPRHGRPMTKEGVRLILRRAAAAGQEVRADRGRTKDRVNRHTQRSQERRDRARGLYASGMDEAAVAKELGLCGKTVRGYLEGVPGFDRNAGRSGRSPSKSLLSYDQIVTRRSDGLKIREIAQEAHITPSRVSQVLQRKGDYKPTPETEARIDRVFVLLGEGMAVRDIAVAVERTPSQVYAYVSLGSTLKPERRR